MSRFQPSSPGLPSGDADTLHSPSVCVCLSCAEYRRARLIIYSGLIIYSEDSERSTRLLVRSSLITSCHDHGEHVHVTAVMVSNVAHLIMAMRMFAKQVALAGLGRVTLAWYCPILILDVGSSVDAVDPVLLTQWLGQTASCQCSESCQDSDRCCSRCAEDANGGL